MLNTVFVLAVVAVIELTIIASSLLVIAISLNIIAKHYSSTENNKK